MPTRIIKNVYVNKHVNKKQESSQTCSLVQLLLSHFRYAIFFGQAISFYTHAQTPRLSARWLVNMAEYIASNPHFIVNGFLHAGILDALDLFDSVGFFWLHFSFHFFHFFC